MYLHVFFATILLLFYILELIDKYYFSYSFYSIFWAGYKAIVLSSGNLMIIRNIKIMIIIHNSWRFFFFFLWLVTAFLIPRVDSLLRLSWLSK